MRIIGLTGGAATGKSTVSRILRDLGACIIDVDLIGREVVERGSPCLEKIAAQFGTDMLLKDGSLNRKRLGNVVFQDKDKLGQLNAIVHPVMVSIVKEQIKKQREGGKVRAVVIDAAILIEMGLHELVDCLWLVRIDKETQVKRLMGRDGMTLDKAENIINAQMPIEEKMKYADVVIDNTGTIKDLEYIVRRLWKKHQTYCTLG